MDLLCSFIFKSSTFWVYGAYISYHWDLVMLMITKLRFVVQYLWWPWPCFPCLGQTDWKHLLRIPLHWLWSYRHPGQSCSHSGRSPGLSQTPGLQVKKRVERSKTKTINKYQSLRYLDIVMPKLLWGFAWRRPSSSSLLFGYLLISSAALPDRDQGTSVVLRWTPESEWVSGPLTNCLYPRIIHLRSDSLF